MEKARNVFNSKAVTGPKLQDQNYKTPKNIHMQDRSLSYRMAAYDYLGLRSYNKYLKNHGYIGKIFSNKQFFIEPPKQLLHHVVNN